MLIEACICQWSGDSSEQEYPGFNVEQVLLLAYPIFSQ
jgi:hypothetical protein